MPMKTIKVAEATNLQLNWLVAKAEGHKPVVCSERDAGQQRALGQWIAIKQTLSGHEVFNPTVDWSQMGPIIDTNPEMQFWPWGGSPDGRNGEFQCACLPSKFEGGTRMRTWFGKTKLIAAARCYVASKLGETVEVPEELT